MPLRVALIHDWLIHMRGGEKVLEALYEVFPEADIFTLFYNRAPLSPLLKRARIYSSFLQFLPGITYYYRWLLPLLPVAIRSLSLAHYDVVISSSHCVAKGCLVPKGALHICYCHTPVRYVWGFREEYFGGYPPLVRKMVNTFLERLKKWDLESNQGVHFFIANSENTARRVEKFYGREARVIYPPVDVVEFAQGSEEANSKLKQNINIPSGDYYLVVSALVPYKRIDLAVCAFNQLGYPLVVVGDGPDRARLKKIASPNVQFLGSVTGAELKQYYTRCRALIFPGEEDFGIVPVEAQACGRPVIAYGKGGVLESVTGATGVFFSEQTAASLIQAVERFESLSFHSELMKDQARKFDRAIFKEKIKQAVLSLYETWQNRKAVDNSSSLATK